MFRTRPRVIDLSTTDRARILAAGDAADRRREVQREAEQLHEKRHLSLLVRAHRRR